MDQTALVGLDLEGGERLIRALDQSDFNVQAALWLYMPDANQWRLVLASPYYDKHGPAASYQLVYQVLRELKPGTKIDPFDITVASPGKKLIQALSSAIDTGPGISGIRFAGNTIDNVFVEDAYVYRMQAAAPPGSSSRARPKRATRR